ncbi:MAG: phosphopyruvate hydratase [Nanoarchaeota archaeon]|nr:phosphopyruvate hydratase [Nanoarchaeota archaeon]
MSIITKVAAREILDSRGNPTVEVDVFTDTHMARASVPSGASTGVHEALELRDGGARYNGNGVLNAIHNVNTIIGPKIVGLESTQQKFIDTMLINMDGTPNKSKLGANALLAVSMAVCKAGAISSGLPLYKHIQELASSDNAKIPTPYFNVINGGKHAGNKLDFQEFMIVPQGKSMKENLQIGSEVYHKLKKIIKEKHGLSAVNVGDEGGFAPPVEDNEEPLKLLVKAIEESGYSGKVTIAMDCAASEFFVDGKYLLGYKDADPKKRTLLAKKAGITGAELADLYLKLLKKYPITSIEDCFEQDDWKSWQSFMKKAGIQVVGDDLLVTNVERIKKALTLKACNTLLLKVNQIGTITEAINAANLSTTNGWGVMVSHRSGETEDTFIADLSVGLGTGMIKSGAPCRTERTGKYNQIMRIEESLI